MARTQLTSTSPSFRDPNRFQTVRGVGALNGRLILKRVSILPTDRVPDDEGRRIPQECCSESIETPRRERNNTLCRAGNNAERMRGWNNQLVGGACPSTCAVGRSVPAHPETPIGFAFAGDDRQADAGCPGRAGVRHGLALSEQVIDPPARPVMPQGWGSPNCPRRAHTVRRSRPTFSPIAPSRAAWRARRLGDVE